MQLIISRVQRKNHDKVDRDLKETVNQNKKKREYCQRFSKILTAEKQSIQKCLTEERLERKKSS